MSSDGTEAATAHPIGRVSLCCVLAVASFVWLKVLPDLAERPELRRQMDELESRGIDRTAMFYSDHPVSEQSEQTIRRVMERNPDLFWRPSPRH
ncbi:MAG: hypothetical protein ACPGXX_08545 [Planctomycetaceae bacterium]